MSSQTKDLSQLKRYFFDQNTTDRFIRFLMDKAQLIAPHRKGEKSYSFQVTTDPQKVVLNYPRTIQPLKKFFLPPRETLLEFELNKKPKVKKPELKPQERIFLGVHSYDMKAILLLDYGFERGKPEENYFVRREKSIFIGIAYEPDEHHFAQDLGIDIFDTTGFSLFMVPVEKGFLVFEVDETGERILTEFGAGLPLGNEIQYERPEYAKKLKMHHNRLPQIFEHVYHSDVWKKIAERCVGCGTCNLVCSTCYCFDVFDEVELNIIAGKRERRWDSCMLNPFAEVAGGENFRPTLESRTRHRLYRKFKYITDYSGELYCVGCGRCSKYCPAGISIIEILNELIEDYRRQQEQHAVAMG
jgi:sulfhydrogenase subunit beta (sulfur reductase)